MSLRWPVHFDFLLPPLTFYEYLNLIEKDKLLVESPESGSFSARDIEEVNTHFLDYLNFGGYPEVIFTPSIRADPARFIKSDIIDKVLLRDLPSLYGIGDIQETELSVQHACFQYGERAARSGNSPKTPASQRTL